MTSRRFLRLGLGLIVAGVVAIAGFARWLNLYGQYGDVRGASYRVHRPSERVGKYLFAHNYVPQNFDALLIGSSTAVNWDPRGISGYRMYNLALSGANAADEQLLLDEVLAHGHVRLVVFVINSYLTARPGPTTGEMVPRQLRASLGSPQLVTDLALELAIRAGVMGNEHDDRGTEDFTVRPPPMDVATAMRLATERKLANHARGVEFRIDPVALGELGAAVAAARRHGATVVLVHPAMFHARFDAVAAEYAEFRRSIDPLFGDAPVLDFNTPRYAAIRDRLDSYYDHVHFSRAGAAASVAALDEFLRTRPAR